mgnify:CR=1 FL=1
MLQLSTILPTKTLSYKLQCAQKLHMLATLMCAIAHEEVFPYYIPHVDKLISLNTRTCILVDV